MLKELFRCGDMKKTGALLLSFALSLSLLCSVSSAKDYTLKRFEGLYEPSGVVQLPEGNIVIIEDGKNVPLWVLEPKEKGNEIILLVKQRIQIEDHSYDDLEGIEVGKEGEMFLITSHSQGKNKRKKKRERFLKFSFPDGDTDAVVGENIFSAVMASLGNPVDKMDSLNIEGLGFDHKQETLFLGLRTPMNGDKAIILEMMNPREYFAKTQSPVLLKRASLPIKGGVRAMSFDSLAQRFILASEVEQENGKQSAIWSWNGVSQKVERLKIPGLKKAKNVEGVTTLRWKNKNYLLLVCDDGNKKKKKGAHYLIVPYQK